MIHLFRADYMIEVGTGRRGKTRQRGPGYRFTTAWMQAFSNTSYSSPDTLRNWQATARRDGQKITRHKTRKEAQAAAVADLQRAAKTQ